MVHRDIHGSGFVDVVNHTCKQPDRGELEGRDGDFKKDEGADVDGDVVWVRDCRDLEAGVEEPDEGEGEEEAPAGGGTEAVPDCDVGHKR